MVGAQHVVQLGGHTVQQILGGAVLQPAQPLRVVHRLAYPPAAVERLNLRRRPIVVVDEHSLELILHESEVALAHPVAAPPPLYGDRCQPPLVQ